MPRLRLRPFQRAALAVAVAVCVVPLRLSAQAPGGGRGCRFLDGTARLVSDTIPGAGRISWVSRPRIGCADGVRIEADSAVTYSAQSMNHLIGHVRYRDQNRILHADDARYFSNVGRLQASGHLFLRDTLQGSVIQNGDLVYLRKTDFRVREQMTVTTGADRVRPRALLYVRPGADTVTALDTAAAGTTMAPATSASPDSAVVIDTLPPPPPPRRRPTEPDTVPYQVEADRLHLQGDQYFAAGGSVTIERDSLNAHADSAEYDQAAAHMVLEGSASMEQSSYTLSGGTIDMAMPGGQTRSVRAVRHAVLVGEDLQMRAPVIQLFLAEGLLERLVAVPNRDVESDPRPGRPTPGGPPAVADSLGVERPVAEAEKFSLTADSVDVRTPGQVLDRIFASGMARGESSSRDSINVETLPAVARKDWLEGDTVIATFVKADPKPGEEADTSANYELERLVAHGKARSLYRLLPSDSTSRPGIDPPAVHYVTGSKIVIVLNEGEVDSMQVEGPTAGWHLEPGAGQAPPDTMARPDTGRVVAPEMGKAAPSGRRRSGKVGRGGPVGPGGEGAGGVDSAALPVRVGERTRTREGGR